MVIDAIATAIDDVSDPAARPRLKKCLPLLRAALERVDTRRDGLTVVAATPWGAAVKNADAWPQFEPSPLTQADATMALLRAIEGDDDDDIMLVALALLLGRRGRAAQEEDATAIVAAGGCPVVVALLEREENTVTLLITTAAMPAQAAATLH